MAKGRSRAKIGGSGKSVSFGRNSSTAPSTGSSISSYAINNPVKGKYGAKGARLGNPSSSMTSTGRWGSK